MSQIGKKEKSLSTKSNANKKKTNSIHSKDSTSHFDSFFSLSLTNKKENKDDSLLGSECYMTDISYRDNESDLFKFPTKSKASVKNDVVAETSFESKASESDNVFQEETKLDTSLEAPLLEAKPNNIFNDTTLTSSDNEESNKECIKSDSSEISSEKGNSELNNVHEASILDEEVLIPRAKVCRNPPIVEDEKCVTNKDEGEVTNQCPICLKTVTKYLSHMKSCAAKNKLSTQQLLSALKLHKKQLAERKELGLGLPIQSYRAKVSPKRSRTNDKKGPVDSSLQLALALSASLHSAEENELIQEAEALKEAGLCEEAEQKLSTLEKYGFATSLPPVTRIAQGSSKSVALAPTLLLRRTREDRERIVTEKVAIVLINEDENVTLDEFTTKELVIKSNQLRRVWDKDSQLWTKAHCGADEQRQAFYVQMLSEFVTPSKSEVGENLKRLSQLPGRLNTPERDSNFSPPTPSKSHLSDEIDLSELTTLPQISSSRETPFNLAEISTTLKSWQSSTKTQKLSDDWLALVNNSTMSDITIKCRNNDLVPAHKLVFHVRCPSVLEALVMVENREEFLDCNDSSKDSVLAFLEFVYSGSTNRLSSLAADGLHCVLNLADKFNCSDLINYLRTFCEIGCYSKTESKKEVKRDLFQTNKDSENSLNTSSGLTAKRNSVLSKISCSNTSELNFASTSRIHNSDHTSNSSNGRGSPDMFCESDLIECDVSSQESRDDLDILASLVGKSLTEVETTPDNNMSEIESKPEDVSVINSSPEVTLSKLLPVKRKAQNSSCSEDERLTPFKKVCSDLSQSVPSENQDGVFDLTQSSNSSTEEHAVNKQDKTDKDVALDENIEDEEDCINDLTQRNPSPLNSSKYVDNCADFRNSRDGSRCYDYIDPIWDGFDDNYSHYNYEFNNSLKKTGKFSLENSPSTDKTIFSPCRVQPDSKPISSPKTSKCTYPNNETPERSRQSIPCLSPKTPSTVKYISSESKSPKQYSQKTVSPLSKAFNDIKCVSSESRSPRQLSQSTLDKYSPQSSRNNRETNNLLNNDSDIEIIENYHSPEFHPSNRNNPRKNLSAQFNLSHDNISQTFHHTSMSRNNNSHNSPVNSSSTSAFKQFSQNNKNKTPVKRDSLAAMQRLLDDSLEISDSVFATADGLLASEATGNTNTNVEGQGPSTSTQFQCTEKDKGKKSLMTPSPGIIVSDDVTPLADYSAMKTPALKKELSRFGLKPSLGRRKAKLLLRYIYDQTHPLVAEPEAQAGVFRKPEGQPPRSPLKSPHKSQDQVNLLDSESDSEELCSQRSTSSSVSSFASLPEESINEPDDLLSQDLTATGDVKAAVRSLIFGNPELHRKVLLYEPIYLEDLMASLKANGIKSKPSAVMDFLDEQCITFRTTSWKTTNEKRRQKQRSPRKRVKNTKGRDITKTSVPTISNQNNSSPTKTQTNVVKKRGRPRKDHVNKQV